MESELSTARESFEVLKTSHDATSSDAVSAAEADRAALVKAHADLEAIATESERLKQAQASALDETQVKIAALEAKAQESESLTSQLATLKTEKEDTATKVSELEIEILETKEAQEALEDSIEQLKGTVKTLESSLAQAKADLEKAAEDRRAAEGQHATAVEELRKNHSEELIAAQEKHSQVVATLQATEGNLEAATLELEKAKKAVGDAEEAHKIKLQEVEQAYMSIQNELTESIATISAELEVCVVYALIPT